MLDATARPADALDGLLAGNRRFVDGLPARPRRDAPSRSGHPDQDGSPSAVVFGCSDSPAPPEILFDAAPGALYVVRTPAHALGPSVFGSLELGVVLGARLVVVLGHDGCGAVRTDMPTHVRRTAELLLARSRLLAGELTQGRIGVVGLTHEADGRARTVVAHGAADAAAPAGATGTPEALRHVIGPESLRDGERRDRNDLVPG